MCVWVWSRAKRRERGKGCPAFPSSVVGTCGRVCTAHSAVWLADMAWPVHRTTLTTLILLQSQVTLVLCHVGIVHITTDTMPPRLRIERLASASFSSSPSSNPAQRGYGFCLSAPPAVTTEPCRTIDPTNWRRHDPCGNGFWACKVGGPPRRLSLACISNYDLPSHPPSEPTFTNRLLD